MADPISSPDQEILPSLLFKASHEIALAESEGDILSAVTGALRQTDFITSLLMVDHENIYFVSFYDPQIGEIPLHEKDSFPTYTAAALFTSAEPLFVTEIPGSPSLLNDLTTPFFNLGAKSVVLIPAFSSKTLMGLVLLASRTSNTLTGEDLLPFIDLVDIMAKSLTRLNTLSTVQTRLDGMHHSLSLALNVLFETDLEPLYQVVHNQVRQLFGKVDFLIAIYHPENEMIEIPYGFEQETRLSLAPIPMGEGLTSLLIKNRKPMMIVEDAANQARALGAKFFGNPAKSWMGVPLIVGDLVIGAMIVEDIAHERRFNENDLDFLMTLSPQVAAAIRNAQMVTEIQKSLKAYDEEKYLLSTLMDNIPDKVYFKDRSSHFIRANRAMLSLFNTDKMSDLVGKSDFDYFTSEYASQAFNNEQEIIRTGKAMEGKLERETWPNRPDTWVLSTKAPLRDPSGNIIGILGISREVTELVQVREVAQRRAQQVTTAAEIARDVSSALQPAELLKRVVNLVRARFGFYHASVFLVDSTGEFAVLRESTGEAGRQMKEAGHKLAVGSKSTVGQATATGDSLVINDVTLDPTHRPNPLLPDTRAECAIPLKTGDRILGALDVQSTQINAFSPDDVSILQTLADQISTAIANSELLAETQANLGRLNALMDNINDRVYFKDLNSRFIMVNKAMLPMYHLDETSDLIGKSDFDFYSSEHASQAFNDEQEIIRSEQPKLDKLERETYPDRPDTWALSSKAPLRDADGKIIGIVGISRDVTELVTVREMAERRAQQLTTAAEIARDVSSSLQPEELLNRVVNLVRDRFGFYHASVFLVEPSGEYAILRESTGEAGRQMKEAGHKLAVGSKSTVGQATATGKSLVINDVTLDPTHRPNPLLPDTRAECAIPLQIGARILGAMDVQSTQPNAFSPDDINILQILADQLSTAIANSELLAETQANLTLLSTMMDNITDKIYFKDRNSRFIRVNRPMLELFNTDNMSDLVGKSDSDFFSKEHAAQAFNDEQEIVRTGIPQADKLERETWPDRPDTWVLSTKAPLRDPEGNVVGIFGISREVTDLVRVRETAQRSAQQLMTAAEIARDISSALNPEELLALVVNLILERFGFYQASVFLLDPAGEYAVLRESTGEAGRRMKEAGHKLAVGSKSIIGQTTATGKALVVNDVTSDPTYLPNPLLPETRAELGIPLKIGSRVLGALDVQSIQPNTFSPDDVNILQTLADQLSTAIVNAELLAETQANLARINALMDNIPERVYFKDRDSRFILINRTMLATFKTDKMADILGKSDFDFYGNEHASQAFNDEQEIMRTEQAMVNKLERETYPDRPDTWSLSTKAPLRDPDGNIVGTLGISGDVTELVQVRETAQRRAQQLLTTAEIARDVSSALQPEELLGRVVNLVRDRFGFYQVSVFLIDPAGEYAVLRESTGEAGRQLKKAGHKLGVGSKSIVGQAIATGKPLVVNDVALDPTYLPNPLLPDTRAELAIPLTIGERVLGIIDVQSTQTNVFSPDDVKILQMLADQLSTAIANSELFAETQKNLAQQRLLYQVTTSAASISNLDEALINVVNGLKVIMEGIRITFLLYNPATNEFEVKASAGYENEEEINRFKTRVGVGVTGIAARDHQVIYLNDVTKDPRYLSLDKEVMSELALPLIFRNEVLGVLNLESPQPYAFTEGDQDVLATLASSVAVDIANTRLLGQIRQQVDSQRQLFEAANKIRRSVELKTILETSANEIGKILGAQRIQIEITAPGNGQKEEKTVIPGGNGKEANQ